MAAKVKKGDRVIITAGRNKGAKGEVLKVIPAENRVVVQGVNVVKRHQKPVGDNPGAIVEKEAPIHISNVMVLTRDNQTARVSYEFKDVNGTEKKVRVARRTNEAIDE